MKIKRLRLKKEVKVVLFIMTVIVTGAIISHRVNNFEKMAEMCDQEKGHVCSIYEAQQYIRGID